MGIKKVKRICYLDGIIFSPSFLAFLAYLKIILNLNLIILLSNKIQKIINSITSFSKKIYFEKQ